MGITYSKQEEFTAAYSNRLQLNKCHDVPFGLVSTSISSSPLSISSAEGTGAELAAPKAVSLDCGGATSLREVSVLSAKSSSHATHHLM